MMALDWWLIIDENKEEAAGEAEEGPWITKHEKLLINKLNL